MKLEDVMVRDVVTASPSDGIAVAAKRMRDKRIGSVVVTADGAIKGIMTDRDILSCLTEGHNPYECKIAAHISRPVIVERSQEDLLRAAEIMSERRQPRARLSGLLRLDSRGAIGAHEWPFAA